ncbi:52 kDa repressor of the inhibitor of the protein kinase-like [Porites lutea]|uniref:52 kDa repressor of the inhibitor of the protein kinase-like n=1 Tax=Porites lutea TaxID=51062 RepID=UPI003CC5F598
MASKRDGSILRFLAKAPRFENTAEPQQSQLNDHDAAVETAVISQSEMVVTSPTTESAPVPEGYGTTPDHIILQPDKTGGLGDIGRYINSEMTTKEVEDTVIALSRGKKYELLTQHFSPPSHYKFPGTYENGCLRSFRVNVAVPFFDHIISELDDQFSSLTLRVSKLLGLVPSVIQESRVTAQQLTDLVDLYKDDLPSPQLFSSEFQRWKIMVQNGRIAADSCASSLKACDPDDFPNLYMLLKIAATLPVTTCECERSISTMRRLNNYMRCTMGESRLSSLALMHIKYDMPVNLEEIVNLFEGLHPRMMQFASLLYE